MTTAGGASTSSSPAGAAGRKARAARVPGADWMRFNYDAQRTGVGPSDTGITADDLGTLTRRRISLDGTVDSSPVELHAVSVGGRSRDVVIVTTTYGRTIALDPATGARVWEYVPPDIGTYEGGYRIANVTPVVDPSRRYVFTGGPDGFVRKLSVSSGREVRSGHWPARVTLLPAREKLGTALNISGGSVVVTTGGYVGDAPPYQGHVALINRFSGRVSSVWNSLCSNRHRLIAPRSCPASDSAIWARAGAVVEPGGGRLLVATGNGPFNGSTNWGDSVVELTSQASRVLRSWTPSNQRELERGDTDLGSTAPALLPATFGHRLIVQGGKEGNLALIDLGRAGKGRTGGELQRISQPGGSAVFTQPAVWTSRGRTYVFVANDAGLTAYVLHDGPSPRLSVAARAGHGGTSPVLAGGLLYVYDEQSPALRVYEPTRLRQLAALPLARTGHWNSPIVAGGRIIVPEGDANDHARGGTLEVYHLPGR